MEITKERKYHYDFENVKAYPVYNEEDLPYEYLTLPKKILKSTYFKDPVDEFYYGLPEYGGVLIKKADDETKPSLEDFRKDEKARREKFLEQAKELKPLKDKFENGLFREPVPKYLEVDEQTFKEKLEKRQKEETFKGLLGNLMKEKGFAERYPFKASYNVYFSTPYYVKDHHIVKGTPNNWEETYNTFLDYINSNNL